MALKHQFAVISKDSNQEIISSDMNYVDVPDSFILYINDCLQWIHSKWNGKSLKNGISYYGFSTIEEDDIEKLMTIINQWKCLFELAPDEFYLTGDFLPDERSYEKIHVNKKDVMELLNAWLGLCKKAFEENAKILHNGI